LHARQCAEFFRRQDSVTATSVETSMACRTRVRHADGNNSSYVENNFEMFVARTTGQLRVRKAMLLPSLEGRKSKNNKRGQSNRLRSVGRVPNG
jgi:hypothetical protein